MEISIHKDTSISISLLFSLILSSYLVVPVRELANKQLSTSTISSKLSNIAHLLSTIDMDVDNITREGSTSSNKPSSKSTSVVSDASSIPYYLGMEINNDLPDEITVEIIDSS